MTDFTPTTEQVRDAYVRAMRNAFIASAGEHAQEFDRWLEHTIKSSQTVAGKAGEACAVCFGTGGYWGERWMDCATCQGSGRRPISV